jgi:hypothetical protein
MKKTICLIVVFLSVWCFAKSQTSFKAVLKEINTLDSVTWFGLDFSNANFVGAFPGRQDVAETYPGSWNSLVLSKSWLYHYRDKSFIYDFSVIKNRNKGINPDNLFSIMVQGLSKEKIQKIIDEYNPEVKTGKGLVFIVEGFDKNIEMATIWFTYFDIQSRKIIYTSRIAGKAGGVTMVNHWGNAILNIIKTQPVEEPVRDGTGLTIAFIVLISAVIVAIISMNVH